MRRLIAIALPLLLAAASAPVGPAAETADAALARARAEAQHAARRLASLEAEAAKGRWRGGAAPCRAGRRRRGDRGGGSENRRVGCPAAAGPGAGRSGRAAAGKEACPVGRAARRPGHHGPPAADPHPGRPGLGRRDREGQSAAGRDYAGDPAAQRGAAGGTCRAAKAGVARPTLPGPSLPRVANELRSGNSGLQTSRPRQPSERSGWQARHSEPATGCWPVTRRSPWPEARPPNAKPRCRLRRGLPGWICRLPGRCAATPRFRRSISPTACRSRLRCWTAWARSVAPASLRAASDLQPGAALR